MKNQILLVAFLLMGTVAISQSLPAYEQIKLQDEEDYTDADTAAHFAANYLFSCPIDQAKLDRGKSTQFVIRWMSGNPGYNFTLFKVAPKCE